MSFLSETIKFLSHLLNVKRSISKGFLNPERNTDYLDPAKFDKSLLIEEFAVEGCKIINIKNINSLAKHIFYLHGGGYVMEAMSVHRKMIEFFCIKHSLKVTFIDYPLAPESSVEVTHRAVMEAYRELVKKYPGDNFYLFGDSAGGGLALAFLQILRDQQVVPFPSRSVLMSPWVDLTMSNPEIKRYEKLDPWLSVNVTKEIGKWYAGKIPVNNPMVSPIFGEMDNLGSILLLAGTCEVFYPDCLKLKELLEKADGTQVEFYVGEKQLHDWIIIPIPETKQALNRIAEFYLK